MSLLVSAEEVLHVYSPLIADSVESAVHYLDTLNENLHLVLTLQTEQRTSFESVRALLGTRCKRREDFLSVVLGVEFVEKHNRAFNSLIAQEIFNGINSQINKDSEFELTYELECTQREDY